MPFDAGRDRPAKYQQLADQLRGAIQSGELRPGDALPTEMQLAERYRVSRPTVRAALAVLRAEGLVDARQGSGAYVRLRRSPRRVPIPRLPDTDTDARADTLGVSQITEAGPASVHGDVASLLGVRDGAQAFVRRRLVTTDEGDPRELAAHYFPLLQKPSDRLADRMASLISARMPAPAEAEALGVPGGVPLLAMLLASYDEEGDPIQVMETLWPADRYAIYDEFPSGQAVATDAVKANAAQRRRLAEAAGPDTDAEIVELSKSPDDQAEEANP